MRKEIHYFADDGTEFDSEEECLTYENRIAGLFSSVAFFSDGIEPLDNVDEVEDYGMYMFVRDAVKAEELFDVIDEYISFTRPEERVQTGNVLMWTEDGWQELHKKIRSYQNIISEIEEEVRRHDLDS